MARKPVKILVYGIDSKLPNIALAKVEKYHRDKGDEVLVDLPIAMSTCDRVYVSCIYSWNRNQAAGYAQLNNTQVGGSGYDLESCLPDEIEKLKPRINYGFTTRGCIRKCPFCVVPRKEGYIRAVADLYDIWDGKSEWVILYDNNILALPKHFELICSQVIKEHLKIDFNQGLDVRLLTDRHAALLKQMRPLKQWRFAFDSNGYEKAFRKAAQILIDAHISKSRICVYVLAGFDDTFTDILHRIDVVYNEYGFDPFVMLYRNPDTGKANNENLHFKDLKTLTNMPCWKKHKTLKDLARWANHKAIFKSVSWENYGKEAAHASKTRS